MPFSTTRGAGSAKGYGLTAAGGGGGGPIYEFVDVTFTGTTGRFGPSLLQIRSGISSSGDDSWKNNTEFLNSSSGIILWTVPQDAQYRIRAAGAKGGGLSPSQTSLPGRGAIVESIFELTGGEQLKIVVGQEGQTPSSQTGGGGGGGSYVANASNTPLLVAGGGGGQNTGSDFHLDGFADDYRGDAGGFIGHGDKGAAGGGFTSNGANTSQAVGGASFINGSVGGQGGSGGGAGGFGGGGGAGAYGSQGGGGGYAGGVGADGPFTNTSFYDETGPFQKFSATSFSSESFTLQSTGGRSGPGFVTITKL